MGDSFKKRQILFSLQLLIGSAILYLLHIYLINALFSAKTFIIPLWNIYVFHIISVLVVYTTINFRFSNGKTQVFNPFILLMILKMILSIVFLLPLFLSDTTEKIGDTLNFFVPYFIYLAFEVYGIAQFLMAK